MLDSTNQKFDAVVLVNALPTLPDLQKVLTEIYRVLKQENLLFVLVFLYGP